MQTTGAREAQVPGRHRSREAQVPGRHRCQEGTTMKSPGQEESWKRNIGEEKKRRGYILLLCHHKQPRARPKEAWSCPVEPNGERL